MKKQTLVTAAALLALGTLHGCGGGGGGGGTFLPLAAAPAPAPAAQPPAPAPAPEPVASIDPTACITAAQPGSTADIGNGFEGVWERKLPADNFTSGLIVIDSAANMNGYTIAPKTIGSTTFLSTDAQFFGSLTFSTTDSTWQVKSGSGSLDLSSVWESLAGNGTFSAKSALSGSYTVGASPSRSLGPWTYALANSLTVNSTVLARSWGDVQAQSIGSIKVASDGSFTGSTAPNIATAYGACSLTGRIQHADSDTLKNNLVISLSATDVAKAGERACNLVQFTSATGYVDVTQETKDGVCKRTMSLQVSFKDATGKPQGSISFPNP
ncbi:hypothetical protein [Variovorax sp. GB1P17]|uniref:hypothetical protein n=1 Tax=Variovorax sp. GB1P17 TaxID=3443740 RepID=UPI003F4873BA